jgi:protease-4
VKHLRWIVPLVLLVAISWWVTRRPGMEVAQGSALLLDLEGEYIEAPEPPPLARLTGQAHTPFVRLLSELAKAERDTRLADVILRIGPLQMGWGKAQELRDAIARLREKGRRTVAYVEIEQLSANLEYFVASAADEVWVAPGALAPVLGLAGESFFLGGFFEKLGVDFEVARVGKYKSATEMFSESKMSDANREMTTAVLDSLESQFTSAIAQSRKLSPSDVRAAIDLAPAGGEALVAARLADHVGFLDELLEKRGDPPIVEGDDYAQVDPAEVGFQPVARFALVYGSGQVVPGEPRGLPGGGPVFAADSVAEALEDAAEDDSIAAIVLRVDSPGGSALASDVVWRAVVDAREEKPVVASLSDVAASGGYYAPCGADAVVSNPATFTGSIGVFVLRPTLQGLLDKLGIGHESMVRGAHADLLLATQPLSPATREWLSRDVEAVYRRFVSRVAEGRKLDAERVDAVGQGRVWTGEQALERGLVDRLGGLRAAVLLAKERAELAPDADVALVPYPEPKPLAVQISEALRGAAARGVWEELALPDTAVRISRMLRAWASLPERTPLVVPPVWIEVR